ncbi:MAG: NADH-quinone oxidoreductase subunit C [Candidatus Paracaedimonas acanthamoebae]|uniref:NADH-quinone oxidoreductase subunit C n=1 Tax=Candidatus Paracaedimonas acanthamoebae TaxID=244581 RepID=A0A8J7PJX4_9PROT|nr:NADH-quinone oxidoreductase subunit C [Candidatus Paracaedimonas acanthamoebae]
MDDKLAHLSEKIKKALKEDLLSFTINKGELTLQVKRHAIVKILIYLRDHKDFLFKQLIDLCGVDYPDHPERFEVVYHLLSLKHNSRLRLKLTTDETTAIPSITSVYSAANWFEREAWDMYGIKFENHPDLRRLLTDYNFEGHPLRKDFPLTGFVEVRYDDDQERVVYESLDLPQAYRQFDFLSPWEGNPSLLPGDEKALTKKI